MEQFECMYILIEQSYNVHNGMDLNIYFGIYAVFSFLSYLS